MKIAFDGIVREMTDEEVAELREMQMGLLNEEREPSAEDRIAALEKQNEMLLECVLEMSEIIYA